MKLEYEIDALWSRVFYETIVYIMCEKDVMPEEYRQSVLDELWDGDIISGEVEVSEDTGVALSGLWR